jgi:hypothetical protein
MSTFVVSLHEKINAAASRDDLDGILQSIWRVYWPGELSDAEAQFLADAVENRKPERGLLSAKPAVEINRRVISRFTPRKCRERRTDEDRAQRRNRKRILGGSSALPDTIRYHFTEGERAVACVIAGECKRQGYCDLSIDEIADRAGVGRTTVQNFLHEARRLDHIDVRNRPQRGAKHLTNVVTIVSAEWLAWIKRGPNAARALHRGQISKNVSTTKSIDLRKKEALQETSCGRVPIRKPILAENRFPSHNGDANVL